MTFHHFHPLAEVDLRFFIFFFFFLNDYYSETNLVLNRKVFICVLTYFSYFLFGGFLGIVYEPL